MVYERCLKGKCCGCTLGVTFKLRIYTWLFSRVLYVLSFIPGKVGYSLLQKSHLPNVPEWFSHLFVYESWRMGVRALVPPSWGDVTTCIISIRSKKKIERERETDLYFVQYFSSPHSWNSIQNWQCSRPLDFQFIVLGSFTKSYTCSKSLLIMRFYVSLLSFFTDRGSIDIKIRGRHSYL